LLLYARVRIEPARAGQSHEQSIAVQDGR
jgi:hypothetical protein